jgi:DNA-binding MurR/RpiR family transcriptional regulator
VERDRSFLARVREALPTLHPAERKLGALLCDFPGDLASYTASELAALAGVSGPTVSRFVRRLGYDSYEAARRHARRESETGSRLYLASHSAPSGALSLTAHCGQGVENVQRTFDGITADEIIEIAQAALKARKVWVVGFRIGHAFATYLHWQLTQVIEDIIAIPAAGQTIGEHLVSIEERDLVIVFGLRRRLAQIRSIVAEIGRRRAKLLYITDESASTRDEATWHIRCQTKAPGLLFNHVAVMAACHLIADQTIEQAGQAGRTRLRRIETLNESLGEL